MTPEQIEDLKSRVKKVEAYCNEQGVILYAIPRFVPREDNTWSVVASIEAKNKEEIKDDSKEEGRILRTV